ncbi:fungalysin metallopeptidase [Xylaria bambusicola]|uniref:fungalysin metallopeptidase n=1 Tax=Xylaria bambusicola TaxID=326684 RepID=UPI002008A039|nr:fungalysin metallopeptidase [Xylaria bambusicola]KAI0518146.1 fungalysin metallopeptidase [Xylaria bambusicola]
MRSALLYGLLGASILADAHPSPKYKHHKGVQRRTVDVNSMRVKTTSQYVNHKSAKADQSLKLLKRSTYVETATELVKKVAPNAEFRVAKDHYVGTNGVAHVYFRQTVNGLDVGNANFNVNIGPDGSILSYGHSFYNGELPKENPIHKREFTSPIAALEGAMKVLGLPMTKNKITIEALDDLESFVLKGTSGAVSDPTARLTYLVKPDGKLALTWKVETNLRTSWLHSYMDASNGSEIHGLIDWVWSATYKVFPWDVDDPQSGKRQVLTDPWELAASEFTWQSDGEQNYTVTQGNNGMAYQDWSGETTDLYQPNSSDLEFEYDLRLNESDPNAYRDASLTQLWYTANYYHDILYDLGFNEEAGNFQANNNGKGGKDNDAVILSAQDTYGTDNALFVPPPDGQNGIMLMLLWTQSNPRRDCTFEKDVVVHEYTHGLSTRLTGGPDNSDCLSDGEASGMGEGWSDFYAIANALKDEWTRDTPVGIGAWVYNDPNGLRSVPYTSDMEANPNTYATLNGLNEEHDIGETWTTVLWEVFWNLVDKHGRNTGPKPVFNESGIPADGNFLTQKIVMDGMALQPCNPTFVSARDAILDADEALTGGDNACEIWTAFAKRGLGEGAVYDETDRTVSFDIPEGVC